MNFVPTSSQPSEMHFFKHIYKNLSQLEEFLVEDEIQHIKNYPDGEEKN